MFKEKKGFTLVELLVVISIMGVLALIVASNFLSAQRRSRDAKRKADLATISKAITMYYNDYGYFPGSQEVNQSIGTGAPLVKGEYIYMKESPFESVDSMPRYVYVVSTDLKSFNLFAELENRDDGQCKQDESGKGVWYVGGEYYCYGISSNNVSVGDLL